MSWSCGVPKKKWYFIYVNLAHYETSALFIDCHYSEIFCVSQGISQSVTMQYAGLSWDELKHVRQAVGFLVCEAYSLIIWISSPGCCGGGDGVTGSGFGFWLWLLWLSFLYFLCIITAS